MSRAPRHFVAVRDTTHERLAATAREREMHGREVTEGELLERAINRFLDTQGWPRAATPERA